MFKVRYLTKHTDLKPKSRDFGPDMEVGNHVVLGAEVMSQIWKSEPASLDYVLVFAGLYSAIPLTY